MYVTLHSSTCFEQHAAHPQEDQLYHHSLWYCHSSQAAVQYASGERTAVRSPPTYCTAAYRGWRFWRPENPITSGSWKPQLKSHKS